MFHFIQHDIETLAQLNYYHSKIAETPDKVSILYTLTVASMLKDLSRRYNVVFSDTKYILEEKVSA